MRFAFFSLKFFAMRSALLVLRSRNYCVGGCLPAEVRMPNAAGSPAEVGRVTQAGALRYLPCPSGAEGGFQNE